MEFCFLSVRIEAGNVLIVINPFRFLKQSNVKPGYF